MEPHIAALNALKNVLEILPNERVVIICDKEKADIGEAFARGCVMTGSWTRIIMLEPGPVTKKECIRHTVPEFLSEAVTGSNADVFINLMRGPSSETPFRIKLIKLENRGRIRLGHCPGITLDMMESGALALTDEEYKVMQNIAQDLMASLANTVGVHISNDIGTDLTMRTRGRPFFTDTKLDWKTYKWMNLPVGEVLCGPEEDSLEGTLVCDLAIGGVGRVKSNVTVKAKKGKAVSVESKDKIALKDIQQALATDKWSDHVGEFAFGLNPKARLVDEFLETEKLGSACHIAFGNNLDYPGGKNPSANHMDLLISKPTVEVTKEDGSKLLVMKKGKIVV
jgi:hypothetical protein